MTSIKGIFERIFDWKRCRPLFEVGIVLAVVVLAGGLWVFAKVANRVHKGDIQIVDRTLLLALRNPSDSRDPLGPPWLEEVGRDLTAMGGAAFLTLLTTAFVIHLILRGKPRSGAFLAASVIGALSLSLSLKGLFNRARPDLVPQLSHVVTSSFPSGHSMLSASVYLTLGALTARLETNRLLKAHILIWALLFTILAGFSRVYVGVHWPTDVLAGWAAGAAWAALSWIVARILHHWGKLE